MTALPLTDRISQSSTRTRKNRVLSASFGDGYSQEAPDGTNPQVDEWSLQFDYLTSSERSTLVTALEAVGSWGVLTWTPPGETSKKWKVVDGWGESYTGNLSNISVTLRQVFV